MYMCMRQATEDFCKVSNLDQRFLRLLKLMLVSVTSTDVPARKLTELLPSAQYILWGFPL